jgi:hypothetical protein
LDPRSSYVEQFWLPVLGPSATWLLHRLADGLEAAPQGFDLDLEAFSCALGLGFAGGRYAPVRRAIGRCVRFDLAQWVDARTLAVRRLVAPLPQRHLGRLSPSIREQHRRWEVDRRHDVPAAFERRARLLALDLVALGEDRARTERHLARWGFAPELASRATHWASARHGLAAPEDAQPPE